MVKGEGERTSDSRVSVGEEEARGRQVGGEGQGRRTKPMIPGLLWEGTACRLREGEGGRIGGPGGVMRKVRGEGQV